MKSPITTSREVGSILSKKKSSAACIFANRVGSPVTTTRKTKNTSKV